MKSSKQIPYTGKGKNAHLPKLTSQRYIFFPRLKLLMLSSKMSHTAALHLHDVLPPSSVADGKFDDVDDVDATVDRGWAKEDLDATLVRLDDADDVVSVLDADEAAAAGAVAGSTSTTRNTALPSRTLRTLSASQSPRDEEEGEWEEDPIKASQKALPNLRRTVWLAMAANIACCCSFWGNDREDELAEVAEEDCEGLSEGSEALPLGWSKGEVGGVGYAEDDE